MKIIVDAMGGDNAPLAPVEGALRAAEDLGVEIILTGPEAVIRDCLTKLGKTDLPQGVEIAPASEVITMEDNPARAFKDKPDSSMTVGLNLLKAKKGDAFVSAGSTGALLSAATLLIKRIRGIRRAALAPVVPTANGKMVLIDCGATAEGTPEYLMQFAYMGSYYAQRFLGVENPRVALLNIGAEESKGLELQKQTYALLTEAKQAGRIHFVGNVEAREITHDQADVIVCDGFVGNVILKFMEGVAGTLMGIIKKELLSDTRSKLGALLAKPAFGRVKKAMDYSEVGGAPLLGVRGSVVKAHGSSNGHALACAIGQAVQMIRGGVVEKIEALLPQGGEQPAEERSARERRSRTR